MAAAVLVCHFLDCKGKVVVVLCLFAHHAMRRHEGLKCNCMQS